MGEGKGEREGRVGKLSHKPIAITSPPYEDAISDKRTGSDRLAQLERNVDPLETGRETARVMQKGFNPNTQLSTEQQYGTDPSNIGNHTQESYLSAMRLVYAEIAKVSDVCVVVTKNPTRNHALRRLDLDTLALLEEAGFSILCQHKALLFEETEETDLFGRTHKKVKGRMSFFKRLSWQKGSPVAAWEDVIFAVKNPSAALRINSGKMVTLSSPPYSDQDGKSLTRRNTQVVKNSYVVPDEKPRQDGYGSTPGQIGKLK